MRSKGYKPMFSLSFLFFFKVYFVLFMVEVVCHMTKRNLCFSLMTGKFYILFFLFPVLVEVQQYQSKGALHVS